jgi:transposase
MQTPLGTQAGNELIWTTPDPANKEVRHVYFGLGRFGSYRADDLKARNILVGLVGATKVSRSAIAKAFGINRCLVPRYVREIMSRGVEGVVQDGRGRKGKITPEIERLVGREFRKLYGKSRKHFTAKLITKVKTAYGMELSRELIRQIIQPIRAEIKSGARPAAVKRRRERVLSDHVPAKVEQNGENGAALMRALQVGFYSRYAGGLLLNVFVAKLIEGVFAEGSGFGGRVFALMVLQMVQFDAVNLERVKRLHREEFGLLVGRGESPTLATMRRNLTEMVEGVDGQQAMVQLARNYMKYLSPESSTFYMDDHFDPYWGKAEVLEGFSNVYHKAMEGMEHCFVHDGAGNPIFFSLRDEYHSFNEVLPYMAERLQRLVGAGRTVRLVFDRGGYDQKVFGRLGRMGIEYAVWAKGDKTDYEKLGLDYEEEEFEFRRNVPEKPRRVKMGVAEVELGEGKKEMPKRKIVLRRAATRRMAKKGPYLYSAFVTNDGEGSKRAWVEAMIFRWRQECDFKMQSAEFGLDQITTYRTKGYREGAHEEIEEKTLSEVETKEADNLALKPWRRRKRQIKTQIAKIDEQLGQRVFSRSELDLRTVSEMALERGNRKWIRQRKQLVAELEQVIKRMKELPAKVNKLELLKERDIRRFDFRKKIVMDLLRVAAHNARRMALGVLDKHYHNYRDQVDFLRRLIRCGGEVKMGSDGGITVSLSRLNTPAENQIATAFLHEINSYEPVLLGADPIPIQFRLRD